MARPLYKLLKKGTDFEWNTEQENSFQELKDRLVKAPILIGKEKPIHFISRSLKPFEKNYSITDLEGTAAFYSVKKFKPYISSNNCSTILYTDHKPLVSLFNSKEPNNARQTRWVLLLSMLKVRVQYEPGKKNVIADASRGCHPSKAIY